MKIKLLIFNVLLLFLSNFIYSQELIDRKVSAVIFANFHTGISESTKDNSAFEVRRAYFGYLNNFNENYSAVVKLDIGSPNDESQYSLLKRFAYFKNAYIEYKKEKLSVCFGLIDLFQFKIQEKFWNRRYITKSFQDEYKFGNSADLGIMLNYKISENITTDFAVANGEGYNGLQTDNAYLTAAGITCKIFNNLIFRAYTDRLEKNEAQQNICAFIGYQKENNFSLGIEYNHLLNYKYKADRNMYGWSLYSSYFIFKNIELFARFDKLESNKLEDDNKPWNLTNDGSSIITGIEYSPIKNIRYSLNYQDWYPEAQNIDNFMYIYFNVQISF